MGCPVGVADLRPTDRCPPPNPCPVVHKLSSGAAQAEAARSGQTDATKMEDKLNKVMEQARKVASAKSDNPEVGSPLLLLLLPLLLDCPIDRTRTYWSDARFPTHLPPPGGAAAAADVRGRAGRDEARGQRVQGGSRPDQEGDHEPDHRESGSGPWDPSGCTAPGRGVGFRKGRC